MISLSPAEAADYIRDGGQVEIRTNMGSCQCGDAVGVLYPDGEFLAIWKSQAGPGCKPYHAIVGPQDWPGSRGLDYGFHNVVAQVACAFYKVGDKIPRRHTGSTYLYGVGRARPIKLPALGRVVPLP